MFLLPVALWATLFFAKPISADAKFFVKGFTSSASLAAVSNFADPETMNQALREWAAASKRATTAFLEPCPIACLEAGLTATDQWYRYASFNQLSRCSEPMLLDLPMSATIESDLTHTGVKACVATAKVFATNESTTTSLCTRYSRAATQAAIQASDDKSKATDEATSGLLTAVLQIHHYFVELTSLAVVGVFAGSEVSLQGISTELLQRFVKQVQTNGSASTQVVQMISDHGSQFSFGIAASLTSDVAFVHNAVKTWSQGARVSNIGPVREWSAVAIDVPAALVFQAPALSGIRSLFGRRFDHSGLRARDDCRTTTVQSGDGCEVVAQRCGISVDELTKYNSRNNFCGTLQANEIVCCSLGLVPSKLQPPNPDGTCQTIKVEAGDICDTLAAKCGLSSPDFLSVNQGGNFCNTIQPGQSVCCGSGKLPDLTKQPNPDGSCVEYSVKAGDSCSAIAASAGITVDLFKNYNNETWGFGGCSGAGLVADLKVCMSPGYPPMPVTVPNTQCGPQVPGTKRSTNGTKLTDLNPCPLKACCNIWGQCGTTDEFCTITKSETGNPGTAAKDTNGCISNCGTAIVKSNPPEKEMRVGYFTAWNMERSCLTMHADSIDTSQYTHIHFAFADITPDFQVNISNFQDEFNRFKTLKDVKKIISFGGWAFSTTPATQGILRSAVQLPNRQTFTNNIVKFVNDNDLDGVDLDWEYPAEQDIPGIPQGDPEEGLDYFAFLFQTKRALPATKSVSFAAPASYWYLKAFPMNLMGFWLDYVIYMTYDLHGQWDYSSKWASPGCSDDLGNCLRSHVNLTETANALSMITKAGVASNKIVVGISSYGRSFHMAEAGCTGPMCRFTGSANQSDAAPGICTETAGYISNAEIEEIISQGGNVHTYTDAGSNILVYDDVQWVAYLSDEAKIYRQKIYSSFNMAGTSDWAIDLQHYVVDNSPGSAGEFPQMNLAPCDGSYDSLDAIIAVMDTLSSYCIDQYVTKILSNTLNDALTRYDNIMKSGYDEKFGYFAKAVKKSWEVSLDDFYQNYTDTYFDCVQQTSTGPGTWKNESVKCPPHYTSGQAYNIYMIPKNADEMYDFIEKTYNIMRDWVYGARIQIAPCVENNDCNDWGNLVGTIRLRPDFQVPNPKDSIQQALANLTAMADNLADVVDDIEMGLYTGITTDAVDASSTPVFMIQSAVENMQKVEDIGEEVQKKERENLILMVLGAVLFILPGLGEAISAVSGLAIIARIAALVSDLGGAAIGVYDIASDPKDAGPLAIFGLLMAGLALRGGLKQELSDAAKIRRGLRDDQIKGLGTTVQDGLNKVGTLVKLCSKA